MWLLTTVLLGGGPMEVPVVSSDATMVPMMGSQPVVYSVPEEQPRGLLQRIGSWFHRSDEVSYSNMGTGQVIYMSKPTPAAIEPVPQMQPITLMPANDGPQLTTAEPPRVDESIKPVSAVQVKEEVKKDFQSKVGHADDYSWITGQLFFVHADGGVWVLRYSSVSEEDRFGGSAVLAPAVNMKNYREGDLVSVSGEVLDQGRASRHLGGCLFRASSIDLIERAD
jgi:hypothetical protein